MQRPTLRSALVDMWRRYPLLRAALLATLTCWAVAAILLALDVLNLVTLPDRR